jgi:geranylgeranyl diphosphate synthase type II
MIEEYLGALELSGVPELDRAMHYALDGGKRVRARLCLAAARAGGADEQLALPAAAALELIQAFSLVHDDLPALDDDRERRGRPTAHVEFGEGVAVLIGDGLLNAAFGLVTERLEVSAEQRVAVLRELATGIAGMVDGQYLDITSAPADLDELGRLHRLKTGALMSAAVGCGLHVAGLDAARQRPYRAFAAELGLIFQIVDDVLDADAADGEPSYVEAVGAERARTLAAEADARARAHLAEAEGDTTDLERLADLILHRTA